MSKRNFGKFQKRRGHYLRYRQQKLPGADWNYDYIEYYRKAYEYENDPDEKESSLFLVRKEEAKRDFFTGKLKEINHLVQFDQIPRDLKEAKWDIYKISISNAYISKDIILNCDYSIFHEDSQICVLIVIQ